MPHTVLRRRPRRGLKERRGVQESQHPQVAQSRGRRGPRTASVGSERDLVCGWPRFSWGLSRGTVGDSAESSAVGTTSQREPSPGGHVPSSRLWLAGSAGQLGRSEANLSLPAATGGGSEKPRGIATLTSLFILDGSDGGSEFAFILFPP